jgi:hypothetical protein
MQTILEKVAIPFLLLAAAATGFYNVLGFQGSGRVALPAVLVLAAVLVAFHLHRISKNVAQTTTLAITPMQTPAPSTIEQAPAAIEQTLSAIERAPSGLADHVRSNWVVLKPDYVENLFKEHTKIHAQRILNGYIGGWTQIVGKVRDVREGYGESIVVSLQREGEFGQPFYILYFDKGLRRRVENLRRGDTVNVVGEIERVDEAVICIEKCEFHDS